MALAPAVQPAPGHTLGMFNRRRLTWLLPALLLFGSTAMGWLRESRAGGDIAWAGDYASGLALAQRTHRPLLLSFHTPGCGWCAQLDAETFTDPQVIALSSRCVCVRLDSDLDAAVCRRYHVLLYPETLFADSEGRPLTRVPGFIPGPQMAALIARVTATPVPQSR